MTTDPENQMEGPVNEPVKTTRPVSGAMCDRVVAALEDAKGVDIKTLDVRKLTDITDYMVVVTGTSGRHIQTLSERVLEFMLELDGEPPGIEGEESREWILVDFVDVVVHIMLNATRRHYDLESLWDEAFQEPVQLAEAGSQGKQSA